MSVAWLLLQQLSGWAQWELTQVYWDGRRAPEKFMQLSGEVVVPKGFGSYSLNNLLKNICIQIMLFFFLILIWWIYAEIIGINQKYHEYISFLYLGIAPLGLIYTKASRSGNLLLLCSGKEHGLDGRISKCPHARSGHRINFSTRWLTLYTYTRNLRRHSAVRGCSSTWAVVASCSSDCRDAKAALAVSEMAHRASTTGSSAMAPACHQSSWFPLQQGHKQGQWKSSEKSDWMAAQQLHWDKKPFLLLLTAGDEDPVKSTFSGLVTQKNIYSSHWLYR